MTVTRINEFQAKPNSEHALGEVLSAIVPTIAAIHGCRSAQLLKALETPGRFVVLETWESVEAHKSAAQAIPRADIQRVMGLLAGPPKGEYFG